MTRFVKGVCSLAALAALVAGVPWVLLRIGRLDALAHLRPADLLAPVQATDVLLGLMTVVGWLAWLVVAASVVAEVMSVVTSGRMRPRVPGGAWVQPLVGALVISVVGMAAAPTAHAQAAPVSSPSTSPTASAAPMPPLTASRHSAAPPSPAPPVRPTAPGGLVEHVPSAHPAPATTAPAPRVHDVEHRVERGDDLWSIAERYYGDGMQWRRIARDNHLDPSTALPAGRVLRLSDVPRSPQAAEPVSAPHAVVTVSPGDTLSGIAERELGDPDRWPEIQHVNRGLVEDADQIDTGWRLRMPQETERSAGSAPGSTNPMGSTQDSPDNRAKHRSTAPGNPPPATTRASRPGQDDRPGREPEAPGTPEPAGDAAAQAGGPTGTNPPSVTGTNPPPTSGATGRVPAHPSATAAGPRTGSAAPGASSGSGTQPGTSAGPGGTAPASEGAGAPTNQPQATVSSSTTAAAAADAGRTPPPGEVTDGQESVVDPVLALAGGLGALLAAGIGTALVRRRRQQLAVRGAGRRVVVPTPESAHFGSALARVAADRPEPPDDLPPDAVVLGEVEGRPVYHRLEHRVTWVAGERTDVDPVVAAVAAGLAVQPWSTDVHLVVQGDLPWMQSLDEPQVLVVPGLEDALAAVEHEVAGRRLALARLAAQGEGAGLEAMREDPERWEAWVPVLFVITGAAGPHRDRLLQLVGGAPVGVGVVACADDAPAAGLATAGGPGTEQTSRDGSGGGQADAGVPGVEAPESHLQVLADGTAQLDAGPRFTPHVLDPTARRALAELFEVAASDTTTAAPWWSHDDDLPPNLAVLSRRTSLHTDEEEPVESATAHHPTLMLLGPIDLVGCRGQAPARARRQLVEYCAWILLNPGRTATMMTRELLVAEGTRRSNLSRLRSWLGADENGEPYLPDAYSGRIQLHPAVTSDWERLELLTSGGVNRASTDALVDALRLVRGAPLADAAPGQWTWAEALRVDMACTIRDIAVVLADRALMDQDHDLARWAAARGLRVAPNDELLLCARLRTEHLSGNRPEVERLVLQVTRSARQLGVDLRDDTVVLLQEVMEGRRRATA